MLKSFEKINPKQLRKRHRKEHIDFELKLTDLEQIHERDFIVLNLQMYLFLIIQQQLLRMLLQQINQSYILI